MILFADFGATNLRFSWADAKGRLTGLSVRPTAAYPGPAEALSAYAQKCGMPLETVVMGVAGIVTGDKVKCVNSGWDFNRAAIEAELKLTRLTVLNDLEAMAHALPQLGNNDWRALGDDSPAQGMTGAPQVVIAPGSGLGVAALVQGPSGALIVPTEGGHAALAAENEIEDKVLAELRLRYGHVSAERVFSGPGILALYEAMGEVLGLPAEYESPVDVAAAGLEGEDPLAAKAMHLFALWLGRFAGSVALTVGARGGVWLAGGILPSWGHAFPSARFRMAFQEKGRVSDYLSAIPTRLVTHPQPVLLGLAAMEFKNNAAQQAA